MTKELEVSTNPTNTETCGVLFPSSLELKALIRLAAVKTVEKVNKKMIVKKISKERKLNLV